jgi:hypothetical protein
MPQQTYDEGAVFIELLTFIVNFDKLRNISWNNGDKLADDIFKLVF